jgi:hypothetical protein
VKTRYRMSEPLSFRVGDAWQHGGFVERVSIAGKHIQGKHGGRSIPLHSEAKSALAAWLMEMNRQGHVSPDTYLFASRKGLNRPLRPGQARHLLRQAYSGCRLTRKFSSHAMRKSGEAWQCLSVSERVEECVMIKVGDSTEFGRLLEALAADIIRAHNHYQLYKDLWQALHDHPRAEIQSRTFWQLTLTAHFSTCMQMLCRAYDQEANSLHLHNWLLAIQENLHLFDQEEFRRRLKDNPFAESLAQAPWKPDPAILEEDIRLCSPNDPLVKTLIIHRNTYVAHTGAKNIIAARSTHDDHPLTFGDFERLLAREGHSEQVQQTICG